MYKRIMTGFAALALMTGAAAFAHAGASTSTDNAMHKNWQAKRAAHAQKRLAKFKSELKITSEQEGAWDGYVKAVKAMHTPNHKKMHTSSAKTTPAPQRFKAMADRAGTRAEHARNLAAAVNTLYGQLDSSQKSKFDQHFERMHKKMRHHFKRMKHHHHGHHKMHPASAATA